MVGVVEGNEGALGGELSAGVEFIPGRYVMLSASLGVHPDDLSDRCFDPTYNLLSQCQLRGLERFHEDFRQTDETFRVLGGMRFEHGTPRRRTVVARTRKGLPTDGELRILRVLWEMGAGTVRGIHRVLDEERPTGYTTVLKHLQIMTEKGMVRVDRTVRPQVYEPVESGSKTRNRLVSHLVDRAFDGSAGSLVLQLLSDSETTTDERRAIREYLDRLEQEKK